MHHPSQYSQSPREWNSPTSSHHHVKRITNRSPTHYILYTYQRFPRFVPHGYGRSKSSRSERPPFIIDEEEGEDREENDDDDDDDQNNSEDEARRQSLLQSVAIVDTTERNETIRFR